MKQLTATDRLIAHTVGHPVPRAGAISREMNAEWRHALGRTGSGASGALVRNRRQRFLRFL